jgi:hypothetical protein
MCAASRSIGGVRSVSDALAEAKRCGQELSAVARSGSGSISSLLTGNITNDMESSESGKTVIPFVVGISV